MSGNAKNTQEPLPYLIVGQGLAGSALAWRLIKAGQSCLVVDRPIAETASRVAAGLVNPLLGRKVKPDWRQAECLAEAHRYYQETEAELGGSWWECTEIWRELDDEDQLAFWQQRREQDESAAFAGPLLPWPQGWAGRGKAALTLGAAVLHAEKLVNAQREWLKERGSLLEGEVKLCDISPNDSAGISWQGQAYQGIIWCNGCEAAAQLDAPWLESRQSQGCILDISLDNAPQLGKSVIHFGHWLIRHEEHWRLGATYDWTWAGAGEPSPTAAAELLHELGRRYAGGVEILRSRAAVRPIIRYSQPLAGPLPEQQGHYLFGGLGSRGCTNAHWVRNKLAEHLLNGAALVADLAPQNYFEQKMRLMARKASARK